LFVDADCVFVSSFCTANADWSHTVLFEGAIVYDANGNPEPTVQAIGDSGFNYSAPIASDVPEPSPALMVRRTPPDDALPHPPRVRFNRQELGLADADS
jgi:hypothetical protein